MYMCKVLASDSTTSFDLNIDAYLVSKHTSFQTSIVLIHNYGHFMIILVFGF